VAILFALLGQGRDSLSKSCISVFTLLGFSAAAERDQVKEHIQQKLF
jgi:hypothetical protein